MPVKTYLLYNGSVTVTANDVAHIDMRRAGNIIGIQWSVGPAGTVVATGEYLRCELSTTGAAQTANDSAGIISVHSTSAFLTTSGAGQVSQNNFFGPTRIPIKHGDRLYINVTENGSNTWVVNCLVHVDE